MKIEEILFKTPYDYHWSFTRNGYAVLPQGRTVVPVFIYDEGNTTGTKPYAEAPEHTIRKWIISKQDTFQGPLSLTFDTKIGRYNITSVSTFMKPDESLLVRLREPWKNGFQGRLYVGFLLFVADLCAYV